MKSTVKYEFLDVIQAGEQFKISLVLDEYGNQAVSKAQLNPEDEFATRQLGAQAAFLRDSNHPSIVNFRDNTETELFMEAMAGELASHTANSAKRFSSGEIVSFLRQMLTLLSHLDSRGLTAGQLSPRTILCNEDFSIFKIATAYPKDAAIPSAPNEKIFPPEINSGDNYDVHSSDIYCLGMTCIELALGAANFEAQFNGMYDNSSDLWIRWHENLHETLPELGEILEGFPSGLVEILQRMIAKPLELRFDSADEVLSELNKIGVVDGEAKVASKSTFRPLLKKMSYAALAFLGVAIWFAASGNDKPFKVQVSSTRDFNYQIKRNEKIKSEGEFSSQIERSIDLQKGDDLILKQPSDPNQNLCVSVNGQKQNFSNDVVINDLKEDTPLDLVFSRTIKTNSNRDFKYKLVRNEQSSEHECESQSRIELQDGDELKIQSPNLDEKWQLQINDCKPFVLNKFVAVPNWNKMNSLNLLFERKMRTIKLNSEYRDFVWKHKESDLNGFSFEDRSTFEVNDLGTNEMTHVWVKPNKSGLAVEPAQLVDGWFKVRVARSNLVNLAFVQPIELELVGYNKFSTELLEDLVVTVGRSRLDFDGARFFKANIPYTDKQNVGWETTVEHAGEKLFSQDWSNFSTESETRKIAKLYGKVNIETEDGYTLQSVNGETEFGRFGSEISVPFGEKLDIVVSDSSGVIQLRDSVDWQKQFMFKVGKLMKTKELRSDNGSATFWLSRRDDLVKRKKISVSRFAQLPKEMDGYRVAVEWASGHRRELSLREFMSKRKPIELGNANQVSQPSRSVETELYAGS